MKIIENILLFALFNAYASALITTALIVLVIGVIAWIGFRTGHNDRPWRDE